jgi:hypothetical protein
MRGKRLILIAATMALLVGLSAWRLGLQLAEMHRKERRPLEIDARVKVLRAEMDTSGRRVVTQEGKHLMEERKEIFQELKPWRFLSRVERWFR